jgi:hypothetical protein
MRFKTLMLLPVALLASACESTTEPRIRAIDSVDYLTMGTVEISIGRNLIIAFPNAPLADITVASGGTLPFTYSRQQDQVSVRCITYGIGEIHIELAGNTPVHTYIDCLGHIKMRVGQSANITDSWVADYYSPIEIVTDDGWTFDEEIASLSTGGDLIVDCNAVGETWAKVFYGGGQVITLEVPVECLP